MRHLTVARILQRSSGALVVAFICVAFLRMIAVAQENAPEQEYGFDSTLQHVADFDTLAFAHEELSTPGHHLEWYDPIVLLPEDWVSAGGMVIQDRSLPVLGIVGATTGALLLTDRLTFHATRTFYGNHSFVQNVSSVFAHLGEGTTHMGIAAGFGLYGLLGKDERALRTASEITEALLSTGIAVQVLKRISGRESPQMAIGGTSRWRPLPGLAVYQKNQPRYYSFPSGHIATAMATLTVIEENYPGLHWLRPAGYGILAGLGISLVNIRYHWFSDLPLGMLLGYTFGEIASHHDGGAEHVTPSHARMFLTPMLERSGAGVSFAWVY